MTGPRRRLLPVGLALLITAAAGHGAPAADLWRFWDASNESNDRQVDHGAWQQLLDAYLVTTGDGRTLFRYGAVTAQSRQDLDRYVSRLTDIDPRTLARAEQLPYWINLYNALTVRVVLDHPRADSIQDMGGGLFSSGPWNDKLVEVAGKGITLNDIEHRILRPIWKDRRIHYAVNCASVSCPNLARQAYTRDNTEKLLADGETAYLRHPRGLHFDDHAELHVSSIYDWYQSDFGGSRQSLLDYLAAHRPDFAQWLSGYRGPIHYDYNWALNSAGDGDR